MSRQKSESLLSFGLGLILLGSLAIGAAAWYWKFRKNSTFPDNSAPEITATRPDGSPYTLADLPPKKILLHFWASWCAPCVEEIPELLKALPELEKNGVVVVALSLDHNWDDAFKIWPKDTNPQLALVVLDPEMVTAQAYGSYEYPETYAISDHNQRRILTKWIGPQKWGDPEFLKSIIRFFEMSEAQ